MPRCRSRRAVEAENLFLRKQTGLVPGAQSRTASRRGWSRYRLYYLMVVKLQPLHARPGQRRIRTVLDCHSRSLPEAYVKTEVPGLSAAAKPAERTRSTQLSLRPSARRAKTAARSQNRRLSVSLNVTPIERRIVGFRLRTPDLSGEAEQRSEKGAEPHSGLPN